MASSRLRVLDFGTVSALRSQSSWHALAHGRPGDDEVTLSFARPRTPYVCLGRHRAYSELAHEVIAGLGLPVLRRMVGGGPVYLDSQQLFFQVCLPVAAVPARRDVAMTRLLEPAAAALRRLGVAAVVDDQGEVSVGAAKVCGHGAAQIGDRVVVVGNLITGFDHDRASRIVRAGTPVTTVELRRLMERHVAATPVDPAAWRLAVADEYAAAFGARPGAGRLRADEQRALTRLDALLGSREWIRSVDRPVGEVQTVKVRAGVWVHEWVHPGGSVVLSVVDGHVDNVLVDGDGAASGTREQLDSFVGAPLAELRQALARSSSPLVSALAAAPAGRVSA